MPDKKLEKLHNKITYIYIGLDSESRDEFLKEIDSWLATTELIAGKDLLKCIEQSKREYEEGNFIEIHTQKELDKFIKDL